MFQNLGKMKVTIKSPKMSVDTVLTAQTFVETFDMLLRLIEAIGKQNKEEK